MNWAPWQGAESCTGRATPGARALTKWILSNYSNTRSGGIYNCRTMVGGKTTSLHGEGRATDPMLPVRHDGKPTVSGLASGDELVRRLGAHGRRLGIQCIIWNRRIYSEKSPEGRAYQGLHPHYDHLHIELTRKAGEKLTLATLEAVLDEPKKVAPKPWPGTVFGPTKAFVKSRKANVMWIQERLNKAIDRLGIKAKKLRVDGWYGEVTAEVVDRLHLKLKWKRNGGKVGKATWSYLSRL